MPTSHSYYEGAMHEFFGASAVRELAERAQQEAAEHPMRAFRGEPPRATTGGRGATLASPAVGKRGH